MIVHISQLIKTLNDKELVEYYIELNTIQKGTANDWFDKQDEFFNKLKILPKLNYEGCVKDYIIPTTSIIV